MEGKKVDRFEYVERLDYSWKNYFLWQSWLEYMCIVVLEVMGIKEAS